MTKVINKPILGRGLSALLSSDDNEVIKGINKEERKLALVEPEAGIIEIPVRDIAPNPNQPRRIFSTDEISELASSIKEKGVLQPLLVKKIKSAGKSGYEIIAGERRWRAAKEAGLSTVPVIIKDYSDFETLEVSIIENIQRENLSAVEEAMAYKQLVDKFGYTQEKVADKVGKSRSHITNLIRLLNLPEEVQQMVNEGKISMGHARALVVTENPLELARQIVEGKLNVRDAERISRKKNKNPDMHDADDEFSERLGDTDEIAQQLSILFGTKVQINSKGSGGTIEIAYKNLGHLDGIIQKLGL